MSLGRGQWGGLEASSDIIGYVIERVRYYVSEWLEDVSANKMNSNLRRLWHLQ